MLSGVIEVSLDDLLVCDRLVGGQIEVQGYDNIYRGEIEKVYKHSLDVHFELKWCAYYDLRTDKHTATDYKVTVIFDICDLDIVRGKSDLRYIATSKGRQFIVVTIDVKGGHRLDPNEVIDLDLDNLPKPAVIRVDTHIT